MYLPGVMNHRPGMIVARVLLTGTSTGGCMPCSCMLWGSEPCNCELCGGAKRRTACDGGCIIGTINLHSWIHNTIEETFGYPSLKFWCISYCILDGSRFISPLLSLPLDGDITEIYHPIRVIRFGILRCSLIIMSANQNTHVSVVVPIHRCRCCCRLRHFHHY